jgi:hypothetical protein
MVMLSLACASGPREAGVKGAPSTVRYTSPTVLIDATARLVASGSEQSGEALIIAGMVKLGNNPCMAAGVKPSIEAIYHESTIEVLAMVEQSLGLPRMCTMEYNPIVVPVSLAVRPASTFAGEILVKNVGEMGHDVPVAALDSGI